MTSHPTHHKSFFVIIAVLIFIVSTTLLISLYARGYKLDLNGTPTIRSTGILSLMSKPKSASVYINDHLTTATDDTLGLLPGEYTVKIVKDGFNPWQKTINIKKEIVTQIDAQLFKSVPDLKSLTVSGAINPVLSPDGNKIIYAVASASANKNNGLYLMDISSPTLLSTNKNVPKQLSSNYPNINWAEFNFKFSPNSKNVIATNINSHISYFFSVDSNLSLRDIVDITPRLKVIENEWQEQAALYTLNSLEKIPEEIKNLIATESSKNFEFSSSAEKILYLATTDNEIPQAIITPPLNPSTQQQHRQIEKDNYYVYDFKEDTNFLIGHKDEIINPFWLANSNNIVYINDQKIKTIEYDATNKQIIFAGDFDTEVVFPSPDGNKIITLTAPYQGTSKNLYAILIK
jgi:hypothetical protein